MLARQRSVSGPLVVSPAAIGTMLDCAARHCAEPDTKSEDRLYYIDGFQKVLADKDLEGLKITLSPTDKLKEQPGTHVLFHLDTIRQDFTLATLIHSRR